MRTALLALATTALVAPIAIASAPAAAQSAQDRFEVAFQARETQRRASISSAMRFTDEEAEQFWPIYDQYRLAAKNIQRQQVRLVALYSKNTVGMDDKTASDLIDKALKVEEDSRAAKADYIKKVSSVLSGARYFRIFQIEMRLEALLLNGATKQIPLAVTEEEREILESAAAAQIEAQKQNASSPTT